MEKLIPYLLEEKALEYCQNNVYDWTSLENELQQFYLENVKSLLLEREEFRSELFREILN